MIACVVAGFALAACGGGTTTTEVHGHKVTVTAGDQSVCSAVHKADADYQAKRYTQWLKDMAQIAQMTGTASNPELRKYVQEARLANVPARPHTYNFSGLGAYVGLRETCASLGQGA